MVVTMTNLRIDTNACRRGTEMTIAVRSENRRANCPRSDADLPTRPWLVMASQRVAGRRNVGGVADRALGERDYRVG
jgi:hypothetical protein